MVFRSVDKSQTLLLNEQSRQMEAEGTEVIKFGFGQSPFSPPEAVMEAHRQAVPQHFYSPVQGLPALREAVADFHQQLDGLAINADNILIAPGSKMLIYAVIGMFERVDVLIPAPAWVSYAPQAALWNQQAIRVESDFSCRWNITPETLERAIAAKQDPATPSLLILNYPGNPTGTSYSREELQALAEVCRQYGIYVVSDEIYGLLHHQGQHYSLMHAYPERTMITTGLSKWCGAGGWRIGALILPEELPAAVKETLLGIASETYSCNGTPAQYAAIRAYCHDAEMADYLFHQRRILSALGNHAAAALRDAGIAVHPPEGGFYLLPDFTPLQTKLQRHGIANNASLCAKLLADTGVALLPGEAFGLKPQTLAARLAYVDFDGTQALQASEKRGKDAPLDETFLEACMPKVLEGTRRICDWTGRLQD